MKEAIEYLHKKNNHNHTKSIECIDLLFSYGLYEAEKSKVSVKISNMYELKKDLDALVKVIIFGNVEYYESLILRLIDFSHDYFEIMPYMYNSFLLHISIEKSYINAIKDIYDLKMFFDEFFKIIEKFN